MSLGQSNEERALTTLLANTLIQEEVMNPMNSIGWGHGSPPAPGFGTTPTPEGAQPLVIPAQTPPVSGQPTPQTPVLPQQITPGTANTPELISQMESLREANGKILGKYNTPEEAIKGVGHAVTMAKAAFQQRDLAEAEVLRLRTENLNRPQPVSSPETVHQPFVSTPVSHVGIDAAKAKLAEVLASVVENGGILDVEHATALSNAQSELSIAAAKFAQAETSHALNAERALWNHADDYMKKNHPDSMNFVDEIGLHIDSEPLLQEAVAALVAQGKADKASELAWTSYRRSAQLTAVSTATATAQHTENVLNANEQVRQELVDAARKQAGVLTSSAGGHGVHATPAGSSSQEQIAAYTDAMRREGMTPGTSSGQAFRELVIGPSLDPRYFGA